jgi:tRNA threonylcarbamoyladenosine biosynthesis protein TsaB
MSDVKPILAIETSGSSGSVALYYSEDKYFESVIKDKRSHSEKLLISVDEVLNSAGIKIKDVQAIAVSAGPGSFTGLRIGMSAAKGLAFGAGLPIIPVPTFEAIAMRVCSELEEGDEFIVANKVNSDEIYYAKFQIKDNSYIFVNELQILKLADISKKKAAKMYGNVFTDNEGNMSVPGAVYIAKWAGRFGKSLLTLDFDYIEPNYLKDFIVKVKRNG